jgi:hypothetical protein
MNTVLSASPIGFVLALVASGFLFAVGAMIAWYSAAAMGEAIELRWKRSAGWRRMRTLAWRVFLDGWRDPKPHEVWRETKLGMTADKAFVNTVGRDAVYGHWFVEFTWGEPASACTTESQRRFVRMEDWKAMVRSRAMVRDGTWDEDWWG